MDAHTPVDSSVLGQADEEPRGRADASQASSQLVSAPGAMQTICKEQPESELSVRVKRARMEARKRAEEAASSAPNASGTPVAPSAPGAPGAPVAPGVQAPASLTQTS